MKIKEKTIALRLRRKGRSIKEIARDLNISKSTISEWTRAIEMTKAGKARIEERQKSARKKSNETLHSRKIERLFHAETQADLLLSRISYEKNNDMIALAIMYWCEGGKSDNQLRFTNSDPNLARAFIVMLCNVFKIERSKIRVCLHVHDYHNETEMLQFWSNAIGISVTQFSKTYKKFSDHKFKKEGYKGCVRISYYDSHLTRVVLSFAKKFISNYS
jgi:hypothetical protein